MKVVQLAPGPNPRLLGSKSKGTSDEQQTAWGCGVQPGAVGSTTAKGLCAFQAQVWVVPCVSTAGVKRLESSWHGRPTLEKEREKNSAPPHRRAQKIMVRSSSDSSYMSGSPGGSPISGCEQQPSDLEVLSHSLSLSLGQEPGELPPAPSRPPQESPPLPGTQDSHPPLKLKKSFEILVRKPTTSKPKPPPRKYFKSDSDPQKSLDEREDSLCPSGHTLATCGQVREVSDRLNVLLSSRAGNRGLVQVCAWSCAWLFSSSPSVGRGEGRRLPLCPSERRGPLELRADRAKIGSLAEN